MTDTPRRPLVENGVAFAVTVEQAAELKRILYSMPYAAGLYAPGQTLGDGAQLVKVLDELRERLADAGARAHANETELHNLRGDLAAVRRVFGTVGGDQ